MPSKLWVRNNEDGTLDEIVAADASVHLEQMDTDEWVLLVYTSDRRLIVNIRGKKIAVSVEEDLKKEEIVIKKGNGFENEISVQG